MAAGGICAPPGRAVRVAASLALLVGFVGAFGWSAHAASSIALTTDFPGLAVEPAKTESISLTLRNYTDTGQSVDLAVVQLPQGWEAFFKAGGKRVHRAYVGPREADRPGSTFFNLEVRVPRDARPGEYPIVLSAGPSRLALSLKVTRELAENPVELTTQYPELRGPGGARFEFPVELRNRGGEDQTYQLSAQGPQGWRVEVSPRFEDRQVASIGVKAGASQSLEVKVTPPERVQAGSYPIVVRAQAPGAEAVLELRTVVIGTYDLRVTTPTGRLNAEATAGHESPLKLVLDNTGSADLHNISLSADTPLNWVVKFDPSRIDVLPAGRTQEVTATLRPDGRSIAGDYVMTVRAQAAETSASSLFRVAVRTPTVWGWVGAGIVAVVLVGLFSTFRIYGRR